jgi:hypothetical protein
MNVPMHRQHIHYHGRIMKTLFGLIAHFADCERRFHAMVSARFV